MDWSQGLIVAISLFNGIGMPIIIFQLNRQESIRKKQFDDIHERMSHLDSCFDTVRQRLYQEVANKAELREIKADTLEALNRMRAAISNETSRIETRVTRIEDKYLRDGS